MTDARLYKVHNTNCLERFKTPPTCVCCTPATRDMIIAIHREDSAATRTAVLAGADLLWTYCLGLPGGDRNSVGNEGPDIWYDVISLMELVPDMDFEGLFLSFGAAIQSDGGELRRLEQRLGELLVSVQSRLSYGCAAATRQLLAAGADPDVGDQYGDSALTMAVWMGDLECVRVLLPVAIPITTLDGLLGERMCVGGEVDLDLFDLVADDPRHGRPLDNPDLVARLRATMSEESSDALRRSVARRKASLVALLVSEVVPL